MCGRYASYLLPDFIARLFGTVNPLPNLQPTWNLAPTDDAPVVRLAANGDRHLDLLKWGLVPYFMKDLKKAQADQCQVRDGGDIRDIPGGRAGDGTTGGVCGNPSQPGGYLTKSRMLFWDAAPRIASTAAEYGPLQAWIFRDYSRKIVGHAVWLSTSGGRMPLPPSR
jgi:hypothetical protein